MQPIRIVCTVDNNYAQHCCVMLASLFENNLKSQFEVHIITDGIKAINMNRMSRFLKSYNHQYRFYSINHSLLDKATVSHHISVATYFRLLIPQIISEEIDKILFLDSDIVIRKSIVDFWSVDISEYSHAAVPAVGMLDYHSKLGIPNPDQYFNAGVMLINLDFWRKFNLSQKGLDLINREKEKITWWDQDVLNLLLWDSWYPLELTWNAQPQVFKEDLNQEFELLNKFNYLQAKQDPAIVHFVGGGSCKPWNYGCTHPFKEDYFSSLFKTPWKGKKIHGKPCLWKRIQFSLRSQLKNILVNS